MLRLLTLAMLLAAGCDFSAATKSQLQELVNQKATRAEIAGKLGNDYILYEKKDAEHWKSLENYWNGPRSANLAELRDKANRYPKVLYYTTAFTITWVFLDEQDVARDYFQNSQ